MIFLLLYTMFAVLTGVVVREQLARVSDANLEQWLIVSNLPSGLNNRGLCATLVGAFWPLVVVVALVPDNAD